MKKTDEYQNGVKWVVSKAKQRNSRLGDYVEHYLSDRASIIVLLSNNTTIEMPLELAQDAQNQPDGVEQKRVDAVLDTFKNV